MYIPLRIRLFLNFGRSSFIIGFLFALIGLAFITYFSFRLNWKILLADKDDFSTTAARVTESVETQYLVNESPLYEYFYIYSVGENSGLSGSFLELSGIYDAGQEIRIEYLVSHPEVSRFTGKDRRNYEKIMFLAGLGGVLIGTFFLYPSIRRTRKERKILIAGIPARGKLIHAEPTNLQVNEQTVYNLTFEYSTGKEQTQVFSTRSHMIRNLSEEHYETIIYDPRNPSSAVIIDTLPGTVSRYINKKLDYSLN